MLVANITLRDSSQMEQKTLQTSSRVTYCDSRNVNPKALATFTGNVGYPALGCLEENFCQCSQTKRLPRPLQPVAYMPNNRGQIQEADYPLRIAIVEMINKLRIAT